MRIFRDFLRGFTYEGMTGARPSADGFLWLRAQDMPRPAMEPGLRPSEAQRTTEGYRAA